MLGKCKRERKMKCNNECIKISTCAMQNSQKSGVSLFFFIEFFHRISLRS